MCFIFRVVSCALFLSITACSHPNVNKKAEIKPNNVVQIKVDDQAELIQCKKNLESIKLFDQKEYELYLGRFNGLMVEVKNYLNVREDIRPSDQGTVDAMYKYKTDKVCSEISSTILSALLK